MPELKFAAKKEAKTSDGKTSARTKSEPQRRNGVVLNFDLRPDRPVNEIDTKPIARPNRKMTPELREQLQAKIVEVNDLIRERRQLEEMIAETAIKYNRGLQEIMDLGPFDAKDLQDLSHAAFKALRLYR